MNNSLIKESIQDIKSHFLIKDETFIIKHLIHNKYILKNTYKKKIVIINIIKFLFLWSKQFFNLVFSKKKNDNKNFTFFLNLPVDLVYDQKTIKNFEDFCFKGKLARNINTDLLHFSFNKRRAPNYKSDKLVYCEDYIKVIQNSFSFKLRIKILILHCKNFFLFFKFIIKNKYFSYFYQDFIYHSIYKNLSGYKISFIYHSNTFLLPLITYKMAKLKNDVKTFISLYSMNNFNFINHQNIQYNYNDYWKNFMIDYYLTWNTDHSNYQKKLSKNSKCISIGPIMYYLQSFEKKIILKGKIKILVFDVEPISNTINDEFYTLQNCKKFIEDIIYVSQKYFKNGLVIYIKRKIRSKIAKDRLDRNYQEFITYQKYKFKENFIELPRNTNIFDALEKVDLSISIPYTSPAYIAQFINKESFYYDPSGLQKNSFISLPLINNKNLLDRKIKKLIS